MQSQPAFTGENDEEDDADDYAALAKSERIINGSVALDWRAFPSNMSIRTSVPGAPSAVKQSAIIRKVGERNGDAVQDTVPPRTSVTAIISKFESQPLASSSVTSTARRASGL
ncbi:hypothetical protein HDU83_004452 [Entophlyctis luteolus]|nr:hypothetical protein HDU83_004452 [Entophlyctis luteolus]